MDKGSVWRYDTATGMQDNVSISDGSYLQIFAGRDTECIVVEHGLPDRLRVTVHSWSSLDDPDTRADVEWTNVNGGRDHAAPPGQSALFVRRFDRRPGNNRYLLAQVFGRGVRTRPLGWFDDGYDHLYQGVQSALQIPGGEYVFCVQRSSDLVVCDPDDLSVIRRVALADRGGAPKLFLRDHGSELWAINYDTVVRLDAATLQVQDEWLGQPPGSDGSGMFLGDVWMSPDERRFVVPRPGSGDVIVVDPNKLRIVNCWRTGRQPLEAAEVLGGVVARDWKTGDLLTLGADTA